jgi:hypothetical protein
MNVNLERLGKHWSTGLRTVHIRGVDIATYTLGQPMDDAFDRLYAAFFGKGLQSVDDEFRVAAFQYFDSYINNNVHSPAAHDHYFICLTPIWNALLASGRLGMAERLWELAFEPVQQWEQAHPGELIDKGTLCYFWGGTALLSGNLDRGYLLIHQSVEEDSRTSRQQNPLTPSYAIVSLDDEKPDQAFRHWVIEQATFLEGFVRDYATTHHRSLTIDDVKRKFLKQPPNYDAIFLLTFTVARLHGISGLPDQAKRNPFAAQIQLNLLFDLLLVIEVAIRNVNPVKVKKGKNGKISNLMFYDQALFLLRSAGHPHEKNVGDVRHQFENNFQAAIQDALDGTLKANSVVLDRLQCDVHLSYELRNRGAHEIETVPAIWNNFDRVQRAVFRSFCATVDFLY